MTASNHLTNLGLAATCEKSGFGWPCDEKIETVRNEFATAATLEDRRRIAQALQDRADESVPYIPFGQWTQPVAYRSDRLSGILMLPHRSEERRVGKAWVSPCRSRRSPYP